MQDKLISDEYRALNTQVHVSDPKWGGGGLKHFDDLLHLLETAGAQTVIDYGCGKGGMASALMQADYDVQMYDPAIPGFDKMPETADFLYSLDVLEHVEPDCLDAVLTHMAGLANTAYIIIALRAARQRLPDGRNAHLIVESAEFWVEKLLRHYNSVALRPCERPRELRVLCSRL